MSRSSFLLVALVATLMSAGCSSNEELTIDELTPGQYATPGAFLDAMDCQSIGTTFDPWTPDFDDEAALALALEHAPELEAEETPTDVQQIGPELWAIGDADGVAIGLVGASGTVAFCHRDG